MSGTFAPPGECFTIMQIDLDDLAAAYSHRPASAAGVARAQRAGESVGLTPGDVALDIGGGRGRHAAAWLETGAVPLVIDPASGMTREAASVPGVVPVRAAAQALPLRDQCARLAYFHLSIHYGDWRRSLREVRRVVASGGECWIWTMDEQHHRDSFLARWFPSVGDIDAARFPDPSAVASFLESVGGRVTTGKEVETKTRPVAEWRAAVVARFVSTLQLIPADEFAKGLAAFDAVYPDPTASVEYLLTFDWIRARL